ncbi:MAG TPA: type II toxin-antitoxin system VapB family antitoxin [Propionibacteriaceae bacterium]|nr:type II toxin-antitoxin system VapB family antitoxin [Propionibacteriaceae bacterium]HQE30555.1 type II toxin-antitoxin system VapB family antitoxin [Propionibacteriaceae bacterium]
MKNPVTDRLAPELADATGESLTEAVRRAIEDRLAKVARASSSDDVLSLYMSIIDRGRRMPIIDSRSEDEILGYDDDGLPT